MWSEQSLGSLAYQMVTGHMRIRHFKVTFPRLCCSKFVPQIISQANVNRLFFSFGFARQVSLCSPGCPGTHLAGSKLTEFCLCPPGAGIKGVHHHCWASLSDFHAAKLVNLGQEKEALCKVCHLFIYLFSLFKTNKPTKTESPYVTLTVLEFIITMVLELTLQNRLDLNSQRPACLCLLSAEI